MMSFSRIAAAFALAALLLTATSCGKYEEGPAFSLASKKARVAGKWKLDSKYQNTHFVASSADELDDVLELAKDGGLLLRDPGYATYTGKWRFDEKKEHITFRIYFDGEDEEPEVKKFEVMRLTQKEMWLQQRDGTQLFEIRYKATE